MMFYTVWFWALIFALGSIRAFEFLNSEQALLFFIFALNICGVLYLSGPQGLLYLSLLIGAYGLLQKLKVGPFIAFSSVLVLSFILKKTLFNANGPFLGYTVPAVLGLFYRRGESRSFKDMVFATLFSNQYVGPVVVAENLELKSQLQSAAIKRAFLFLLFGLFLLSLSSFWGPRFSHDALKLIDLPQHILGTLNFMFLNFQGAVFIARGVALLLGIEIGPNFVRPYFARSLSDFWKRWHTSLGRFFSEQFFLPFQFFCIQKFKLKKSWQLKGLSFFALFLTWLFLGMWHGVSVKFFCWGILNALFLALPLKKMRLEIWPVTILLVWIMQVLFLSPDLSSFWSFLQNLTSIKEVGEIDLLVLFNLLSSSAVFYISQKMFDWKDEVQHWMDSHAGAYYAAIFLLVILSSLLVHKGQVVVYGQF